MKRSITIVNGERSITVSGSPEAVKALLAWAKENKRGKHKKHRIVCKCPNDLVACSLKAKFLNLEVSN